MTPEIAEIINGIRTILGVCMLGVFFHYLIIEYREDQFSTPRVRAALAVLIYIMGETLLALYFWVWRVVTANRLDVWRPDTRWAIAGIFVAVFGQCLMLRVFSPRGYGHRTWLTGLFVACAVSGAFVVWRFW